MFLTQKNVITTLMFFLTTMAKFIIVMPIQLMITSSTRLVLVNTIGFTHCVRNSGWQATHDLPSIESDLSILFFVGFATSHHPFFRHMEKPKHDCLYDLVFYHIGNVQNMNHIVSFHFASMNSWLSPSQVFEYAFIQPMSNSLASDFGISNASSTYGPAPNIFVTPDSRRLSRYVYTFSTIDNSDPHSQSFHNTIYIHRQLPSFYPHRF